MKKKGVSIVLMYHGIKRNGTDVPAGREEGALLYDLPLESFREQMHYLAMHKKRVGDMSRADVDVMITFDDGEENNYKWAFPVLKEFGLTATFFFIAQRIGSAGYCSWDQIREMHQAGMEIGSHGFSHKILTRLSEEDMRFELNEAKKILEHFLSVPVTALSIPRGFYNDTVLKMAGQCGYKVIYVSDALRDLPASCFTRVAVKSGWDIQRFALCLQGRSPMRERIFIVLKNGFKRILGERIYNRLRSSILKIV